MKNKTRSLLNSLTAFSICLLCATSLTLACSGGGDPAGMLPDVLGISDSGGADLIRGFEDERGLWGVYALDIDTEAGTVEVVTWERGLEAHFDVTSQVLKPACSNCLSLENFSFDKSAGMMEFDAVLVNPTVLGGYDVRGVLFLDEWNSGRKLVSEDGLTDFWSSDPYHPDPFQIFAKEADERLFGPNEQYSVPMQLYFPTPFKLLVPFVVDASYPGHPAEPVELTNINVDGSVHTTGYDLTVSVDLVDWQGDAKGVYLDCSPLNPLAGLQSFESEAAGAAGETYETWTLHLQYDATVPNAWVPMSTGEFELPLVAFDTFSQYKIYQRITVTVTEDTDPPEWTGEIGIEEVYWGSQRAIIAYYPATDPSGPVIYNIEQISDIPLILPVTHEIVGTSHYAVPTADGANYTFVVTAADQAGNEDTNTNEITGLTTSVTTLWERVFSADLESAPTIGDHNEDNTNDVIFGCDNGFVYCLNGDDGAIQWEFETGGMVKSSAAIRDVNDNGTIDVVIGSNDNNIYAINLVMTQPYAMQTYTTSNLVESSPVCIDQTGDGIPEVVVGSFDNSLYAFEGGTGNLLVSYDTGAPVKATPALEDFNGDTFADALVASGGIISAVNGTTGESFWSYDFGTGFSIGSPAIGDLNNDGTGDGVVGSNNGVYAFDVAGTTVLWANEELSGNFDTSPALGDLNGDGTPDVVISSRYIGVFALDGTDGSLLWESDDDIYMPTSPTLADVNNDGVIDVIVGCADFYLRILNGADGMSLYMWTTAPYGAVTTIPLIADANDDGLMDIIFGTESHRMFAITTNHDVPTDPDLIPWPKFMRTRSNTGNLDHPLY